MRRPLWDPDPIARPSLPQIAVTAAAFGLADQAVRHVSNGSLIRGPCDELAHLLLPALVLAALPRAASAPFTTATLMASIASDADHIPDRLGLDWITRGTD